VEPTRGNESASPRVIVVGAGITGLTAAYRLQQAGCSVTVLEAADGVGGRAASTRRDGFTLNTGATLLSGWYTSVRALAEELGVADQIVAVEPRIGFYGARERRVHWIRRSRPQVYVDLLRTRILSGRSKLRMRRLIADVKEAAPLADYRRPDRQAELDTETVSAYCDRRLNREIEERLIGPLVSGIYLVDGASVSTAGLYFTLFKLAGGTLGYACGMDFITRALAERVDVVTGATVTLVEPDEERVRVAWTSGGASTEEAVDGVVLAVGPSVVPRLYPGLPEAMAQDMRALGHSTVFSVRLALSARPSEDGLVILVPQEALGGINLITFDHTISPGSVPEGKGLLGVLLHHDWVTERAAWSDEQLLAEVLPQLEHAVPGVGDLVEFAEVTRWDRAGLAGEVGSQRRVAAIAAAIDPADRVQLAGEYLTIPGLEGSVVTAEQAAGRLTGAIAGDVRVGSST
jgi:oxygen-dependent protoporphyrinogen oxidase